jgi:signal transduction histidine kinase
MIFCFDSQHAYILGEATKTLSFEDDDIHDKGDDLWLGMTKIPRGGSVCEHTVQLPTNHGSNANDEDATKIHIVNDLREDPRFRNQPYVAGGIKARFYAGVPITTEKGFNIGAFCVLDDNPRDGLEKKDVRFIQEMGSLVMEHLEMLKARAEQRRGTLMVKALNSFMENEPTTPQDPNKSTPAATTKTLEAIAQATEIANEEGTESSELLVEQLTLQHKLEDEEALLTTGRTLNTIVAEANSNNNNNAPIAPETVRPSMSRRDSTKSNTGLVPKKEEDPLKLRDQVASNAMQSAADFIRTAVGADGVLFLDASMSNFGEMAEEDAIDNTKPGRELESFTSDTEGAGSATDTLDRPNHQEDVSKPCSVFGASYGLVPANFTPPHAAIPKKLLQSLLRCHKHGKVFLYGAEGDYTSDTHTSDGSSFLNAQSTSLTSITGRGAKEPSFQRRKRSTRSALGKKLGVLFPEARSLMLLGLWNMSRDRWDAGCIVYSNSPIRVFSLDSEMCYLKAFCDVITAKIGRLDVEMSHKVKSDFMSSISHELRSPLHGILGTAEFIHDQIHDDETSEMIGQIQVCGQTLLDVVDHLLDFSKVNSVSKQNRKQLGADQRTRNRSGGLSRAETLGGMVVEKTNVLLDELTEEVIDTAVYSFCCSKDGQTLDQRKVTVVTDIDPSALSLSCVIAVGAWKRLCINLINNALKYTERGYIVASLKLIPPTERQRRPRARLTITDSGKGISKEFMTSQLFRAFSQEDDLAEGTGLGMSMVAKIVKNLGGHIDVQSKKDVGTTVSVTLPLDVRGTGDGQRIHNRTLSSGPNMISMHCLGFAPIEPYREKTIMAGRDFQIETLRKTCRQLNVMVSPSSWSAPSAFDLAMVTEEDVPELLRILQPTLVRTPHAGPDTIRAIRTKPLLVICRNCRSRRELKESALNQLVHAHIEYVAQPCGPRKLADAIRRCLSNTPKDESWSENSTTPKANSLQRPADPGFPFPARRLSEDPNMQTPRPPLPESFRLDDQDDKPPSLPKDSPMDGIEQQTTVTVTTKTTKVKMLKPAIEIDPSKPTLLLVDDNVRQPSTLISRNKLTSLLKHRQ